MLYTPLKVMLSSLYSDNEKITAKQIPNNVMETLSDFLGGLQNKVIRTLLLI